MVAKNLSDLVAGSGYREIVELAWGEQVTVRDVRITALPVKHWGTRNLWPDDRGYTGFLLQEHRARGASETSGVSGPSLRDTPQIDPTN